MVQLFESVLQAIEAQLALLTCIQSPPQILHALIPSLLIFTLHHKSQAPALPLLFHTCWPAEEVEAGPVGGKMDVITRQQPWRHEIPLYDSVMDL